MRQPCSRCGGAQAVRPGRLCNKCFAETHAVPTRPKENVPLERIRIDGGTQARVGLHQTTVDNYADLLAEGVELPPVELFHDGTDYWLADGFHRFFAAKKAEKAAVSAYVQPGTSRDALLYACSANATHGLPRTGEDKQRSVEILLADPEWGKWSTREIADRCRVSWALADRVRTAWQKRQQEPPPEKVVCERNGSTHERAARAPKADAGASARASGCAEPDAGDQSVPLDGLKIRVAGRLAGVFADARQFEDLLSQARDLSQAITALAARPAGKQMAGLAQQATMDLENVRRTLRHSMPHVPCPRCKGKGCTDEAKSPCRGTGWLTKDAFGRLTEAEQERCQRRRPGEGD